MKKLDTPLTKQAVFKVKMLPTTAGQLQAGFLAFGDGPADDRLIKCGVRVRAKKCCILQGSAKLNQAATQDFVWDSGKPLDVLVTVDFEAQRVKLTLPGETLEAKLDRPLKQITHVGYYVLNAVTEFGPVEVVP